MAPRGRPKRTASGRGNGQNGDSSNSSTHNHNEVPRRNGQNGDSSNSSTHNHNEIPNLNPNLIIQTLTESFTSSLQVLSNLVNQNANQTQSKGYHVSADVIPIFNPSEVGQDVKTWLTKVNEIAIIYGWSDLEKTHKALSRLAGHALTWYKGLKNVTYTWDEWTTKFISSFPSQKDFAGSLHAMLERKKKDNENYATYYYEKMALIQECQITGENAVSCIIDGILEPIVKAGAKSGRYMAP